MTLYHHTLLPRPMARHADEYTSKPKILSRADRPMLTPIIQTMVSIHKSPVQVVETMPLSVT